MKAQVLDMAAERYHADVLDERPSLNASIAKLVLNDSPRHARHAHPRLNPSYQPRTDAKFDVGTVVHRMLLEPERENRVAVVDAADWRTKAAQAVRDQAREEGDTPLLIGEWQRVREMLTAVREQLPLLDIDPQPFTDGVAEQTIVWEERGVLCRARLDWLHNDGRTIDDAKTTKYSAHPLKWMRRTLWAISADVQDAFYRRAVKAVTGEEPDLRFIVMETEPPYGISAISLDESARALGEAKVDAALNTWKRCLETGEWPSYAPRVIEAPAPTWAEADFWDRQQLDEEAAA